MNVISWKKLVRADQARIFSGAIRGSALLRGAIFLAILGAVLLGLAAALNARAEQARQAAMAAEVVTDQPFTVSVEPMTDVHPQSAAVTSDGGRAAKISPGYYDFGTILPDAVVRHDFYLKNEGSGPLMIREAYTTCGCTTAEISAAVIPPGRSARVTLIFDADFHPTAGQTVRRGLILETSDPDHAQMEIWVQARVRR
jgi:hypothetical protein